jgi:peptidoglycan hydrolase-like protein with peptidoglycan-binding domain
MAFSLIWMPEVLKRAGLKIALVEGWADRGRGEVGPTRGVICHHTAGGKNGNMPSLDVLIKGRDKLPGPLSQLGLGRDGTFYVIAAGRCNHAGAGVWNGATNGNASFIGIEAENTGLANDFPWPAVQIDAYHRGVAAILGHLGLAADCCAGHKEYALPIGRKPDPSLDMVAFRSAVDSILSGTAPLPILIPAFELPTQQGAPAGRPTLRRGMNGDFVSQLQRLVGLSPDGDFGAKTEAAVRAFQRTHDLVADGIVGPKSWQLLDLAKAA